MYSMVLMLATATGGEATPAFHGRIAANMSARRAGCCGGGCNGCHGSAPAGCCGGGCGGCYGSGYGAAGAGNYAIYGMGYRAGPVVTFTPYGSTNINPPDGSEKAALNVTLPRDAKLFVDGRETTT